MQDALPQIEWQEIGYMECDHVLIRKTIALIGEPPIDNMPDFRIAHVRFNLYTLSYLESAREGQLDIDRRNRIASIMLEVTHNANS